MRVRILRDFYQIALPEIERLADQTGEIANLVVEEYGRAVYLASEAGNQAVDLNIYPGSRRPLHVTAAGKAILAEFPSERVVEIIDDYGLSAETPRSITTQEKLEENLLRCEIVILHSMMKNI